MSSFSSLHLLNTTVFNVKWVSSNNIKLTDGGGDLSSDSGLLLFREFDAALGFSKTLTQHLQLNDTRAYHIHSNANLLRQKLYQIISGYFQDDAADHLTTDPVMTHVIDTPALASQSVPVLRPL
jgi:hypothetical protein